MDPRKEEPIVIKRLVERMRARVAETYQDKPRTATTIHWVEERVCSCGYSVWRWTPAATEILMSPQKEKKKLRIVIDPIGGLQPGDDGYPEPPFQDDGDYGDYQKEKGGETSDSTQNRD